MKLTIQRFDPCDEVRPRNVAFRETEVFRNIPFGFPFLIDASDASIHEPSLLFLLHHYRNKARRLDGTWKQATAEARAYDLKDWFQLIGSAGLDWKQADDNVLGFYITALALEPSIRTGQRITKTTIARRLDTVYKFYGWARGRYADVLFDRASATAIYNQPDAPGEHARLTSQEDENEEEGLSPRVRPLMPDEYRRLLPFLGPKPSEISEADLTSCRCRLTVDLSVHTGLRVDEVAKLSRRKIMSLRPDPDRPAGACALEVTLTKRLVPRTIRVPNWLVEELHLYDSRERRRCLALASKRWLRSEADAPLRFFVNTLSAGAGVGKGVQKRSLQDDFRAAVVAAGLVTAAERESDPSRPAHTFHDCRHTFAVWLYAALTREVDGRPAWWGGEPPWRTVQRQLGHKDERTTTSRYLTFGAGLTADVGDRVVALFENIRDGR